MEMRNPNITPDMDEEGFHIILDFWLVDTRHHLETFISTLSLKIGLYSLMKIHKNMLTNPAGSKA